LCLLRAEGQWEGGATAQDTDTRVRTVPSGVCEPRLSGHGTGVCPQKGRAHSWGRRPAGGSGGFWLLLRWSECPSDCVVGRGSQLRGESSGSFTRPVWGTRVKHVCQVVVCMCADVLHLSMLCVSVLWLVYLCTFVLEWNALEV
jgi:hypothetical protein